MSNSEEFKNKIEKMTMKEKIAYGTCIAAFVLGWGLTIAGFIVPPMGVVSDSILWVLGQSLLYCGAVVGISSHYGTEVKKFEKKVSDFVKQQEENKNNAQ